MLVPNTLLADSDISRNTTLITPITISEGRVLSTQIVPPKNGDMPTFLFMPGVIRSSFVNEPALVDLISKGFGVVTFNFSTQPLSLAHLPEGEKPHFEDKNLTLKDFAFETENLAKILRAQHGISNIVPVSLSYSGAVSVYLKGFPLIIETAPMTSTAATNEQLESFRKSVIASQVFNPFFGKSIIRTTLDNAYRSTWSPQVESMSKAYGFKQTTAMIDGYMTMSRAAEGFSWVDAGQEIEGKRIFLVGENETRALKNDQIDTFNKLKINGELIIVESSGHIISTDQPKVFASLLEKIAVENSLLIITEDKGAKRSTAKLGLSCKSLFTK
jgi:hypothetical protein